MLFDFDGTLAPNLDLPDMRRRVVALTEAGEVPAEVYRDRYIVEIITAASAWLADHRPAAAEPYYVQAHALITEIELAAARQTDPLPGVDHYLAALRARGLRLGVVTRNCRSAVLATYPTLLDQVETLLARDDVTHLKPDRRHLLNALYDLRCVPGEAAMVGDGILDIRCGLDAGLYTVGVETGSNDAAALRAAGAHEVCASCLDFDPP